MAKTKLSSALLEQAATGRSALDVTPMRKAALRIVQAKTGKNVKQLLGEALNDIFRKYNVTAAYDQE